MSNLFDKRHVRRAFSRSAASYDAAAALQHEVESRLLESLDYLDDPKLDAAAAATSCSISAPAPAARAPRCASAGRRRASSRSTSHCRCCAKRASAAAGSAVRPRVRRRARPAVRRRQRRRAVLESLPAVGRGPAGGVRRIPPRAEARRPAARLHLRPGDADGIARCLRARRRRAARQAVRHDRAVRRRARACGLQATRCSTATCTKRATPTWPALMRELRAIGATNALRSRRHTLTGRARFAAAAQAYDAFRLDDGSLPATWEVITAMAWAPRPGAPIREGGFEVTTVPVSRRSRCAAAADRAGAVHAPPANVAAVRKQGGGRMRKTFAITGLGMRWCWPGAARERAVGAASNRAGKPPRRHDGRQRAGDATPRMRSRTSLTCARPRLPRARRPEPSARAWSHMQAWRASRVAGRADCAARSRRRCGRPGRHRLVRDRGAAVATSPRSSCPRRRKRCAMRCPPASRAVARHTSLGDTTVQCALHRRRARARARSPARCCASGDRGVRCACARSNSPKACRPARRRRRASARIGSKALSRGDYLVVAMPGRRAGCARRLDRLRRGDTAADAPCTHELEVVTVEAGRTTGDIDPADLRNLEEAGDWPQPPPAQ